MCALTGDLLTALLSSFTLLTRVGLRSRRCPDCCTLLLGLPMTLDSPVSRILASLGRKLLLSVRLRLLLLFVGELLSCFLLRDGVVSMSTHSTEPILLPLPSVLLRRLDGSALLVSVSGEVSSNFEGAEGRPCCWFCTDSG